MFSIRESSYRSVRQLRRKIKICLKHQTIEVKLKKTRILDQRQKVVFRQGVK